MYVYFYSLHVSGNYVPIIRRINRINAIPCMCHSETREYFKMNGVAHKQQHSF